MYRFIVLIFFLVVLIYPRPIFSQDACGLPTVEGHDKCCCVDPSSEESMGLFNDLELQNAGLLKRLVTNNLKKIISPDMFSEEVKQALACQEGETTDKTNACSPSCRCILTDKEPGSSKLCFEYLSNSKEFNSCTRCFQEEKGFWTAIGCIYMEDWKSFIGKNIFGRILGLTGIIAFGCILFSSLQLILSQGNPEKLKNAQQMLTSCIVGLLVIIFASFLLKLIGVDILRIYGFS